MRERRFTKTEIIGILDEEECGGTVSTLCLQHGVTEDTFYAWKKKYGDKWQSEMKRLKSLEQENSELKKKIAALSLHNQALSAEFHKSTSPEEIPAEL